MATLRARAVVVRDVAAGARIEEIEVDDPREGEVRVRLAASGVCGSDLHVLHGRSNAVTFPMVLGHEGAGVVESVGPGVAGVAPGDHVACLLGNRVEGIELVVGAVFAGVWLTPINHHLAAEEVAYVVADSGARVLLADAAHAELARRAGAPAVVEVGDELDAALARASDEPMDLDGLPRNGRGYKEASELLRLEILKLWRQAAEAVAAGFPKELPDGTKRFTWPRARQFRPAPTPRRISGLV